MCRRILGAEQRETDAQCARQMRSLSPNLYVRQLSQRVVLQSGPGVEEQCRARRPNWQCGHALRQPDVGPTPDRNLAVVKCCSLRRLGCHSPGTKSII